MKDKNDYKLSNTLTENEDIYKSKELQCIISDFENTCLHREIYKKNSVKTCI